MSSVFGIGSAAVWTVGRVVLLSVALASCVSPEQERAWNGFRGELAVLGAGLASTAFGPATYLGSSEQRSFHVHGLWCGKGFPSPKEFYRDVKILNGNTRNFVVSVPDRLYPMDAVDFACAKHDVCYAIAEMAPQSQRASDCDVILMCHLYAIKTEDQPNLILPRAKVVSWAGGARWRYLSSDCRSLMQNVLNVAFVRRS